MGSRLVAQMELQKVANLFFQLLQNAPGLFLFVAEAKESATLGLLQIVQQALVFAGADDIAYLAIALGIDCQCGNQAGVGVFQTVFDLLHRGKHVFQATELFVVEIDIKLIMQFVFDILDELVGIVGNPVFRGVGGGILVTHDIMLQFLDHLPNATPPLVLVETRGDLFNASRHLLPHPFDERALPVQQQVVGKLIIDELPPVDAGLGIADLREFDKRLGHQLHVSRHELIALLVGGARCANIVRCDTEERLEHRLGPMIGANVAPHAQLSVQHRLPKGRIALIVG